MKAAFLYHGNWTIATFQTVDNHRNAMAYRHFHGWTQADLEAALLTAQQEKARGSVVVSAGAGDVNSSMNIQIEIQARIDMLYHDLSILDPVTYPPADRAQDRARATF